MHTAFKTESNAIDVSLQETRWHKETPETLYQNIPGLQIAHTAGLPTERGGISGGAAVLIPPGWRLDRTEEIIPGRAVLAVMQDRYSTIGLISTYLHPSSKGTELRELITWLKQRDASLICSNCCPPCAGSILSLLLHVRWPFS